MVENSMQNKLELGGKDNREYRYKMAVEGQKGTGKFLSLGNGNQNEIDPLASDII